MDMRKALLEAYSTAQEALKEADELDKWNGWGEGYNTTREALTKCLNILVPFTGQPHP